MSYDLVVKNVRIVRPNVREVVLGDIAIAGGKFSAVGQQLHGKQVYDGKGLLAFPGVVDAHMHTGIYPPLAEDAVSEPRRGTGRRHHQPHHFRSGQYYLNKEGPYAASSRGTEDLKGSSTSTTASAPMDGQQFFEIFDLIGNSASAPSRSSCSTAARPARTPDSQRDFLMIGPEDRYDYAHFEFVMRGVQAARERLPEKSRHQLAAP
jgi:allantoinase